MNYSLMSYTFKRGRWKDSYSVQDLCDWARKLGLDGIDWVTTYGVPAGDLRRIMDGSGLKTVCHTFYADFTAADPEVRQKSLDAVRRGIEDAVTLGARIAMLVIPGRKDCSRDEARRRIFDLLGHAVSIAGQAGVTLTIEPFPGDDSPFVTSDEIREMVAAAPGLKVTYDAGNLLTGGEDPVEGYLRLKNDVVFAHFKDWERTEPSAGRRMRDGRWYRPALVGEGILDYPSLLAALREAGYAGYANIEYEGDDYPPHEATARALVSLRDIEARLT